MALKVRLDVQAEQDLRSIRAYLLEHAGTAIAERVREHIRARIDHLRRNPNIGVSTTEADIRVLPPTRFPYRIYYTLAADAVIILHIRHSARREPNSQDFDE